MKIKMSLLLFYIIGIIMKINLNNNVDNKLLKS